MSNIRQTILLRTDLNLPKGLSEAQVAHISFQYVRKGLMNCYQTDNDGRKTVMPVDDNLYEWLHSPYMFVHGVPNAEILIKFINDAKSKNIFVTEWYDTIYLQVSPTQKIVVEECLIGVALGPTDSDKIKAVIGDLPLLG